MTEVSVYDAAQDQLVSFLSHDQTQILEFGTRALKICSISGHMDLHTGCFLASPSLKKYLNKEQPGY